VHKEGKEEMEKGKQKIEIPNSHSPVPFPTF